MRRVRVLRIRAAGTGLIMAAVLPALACLDLPRSPNSSAKRTSTPAAGTPAAGESDLPRHYSIRLPGKPASHFTAEPDQVSGSARAQAIHHRLPGLEVAPCLERAATVYAQTAPQENERLPLSFAEFVLHWAGCPDPTVTVSVITTTDNDPDAVLDQLAAGIREESFTHIGGGRGTADPPYRYRWVFFLTERLFSMRPVPTAGAPGDTVPILLRLEQGISSAWVVLTLPGGETQELPVGLSGGWAVVGVPLAQQVGRQWVELMGRRGSGPEVLALFPIEVGRSPPLLWVGEARADESWIVSIAQAEQLAAELIRRDRERFGRAALQFDPVLSEIARRHSADMAAQGYFAHVSPSTGSIVDRLQAEGYQANFAAENLAGAPFVADAQDALMRSPGHRAAILTSRATHFGVGIATTGGEDPSYLVTQIFTRPASG